VKIQNHKQYVTKQKQKVHKVAQHKNTLLLFSDRLCNDVTCNSIQILAVLPVSASHIATARRFKVTVPRVSSNKL